MWNLMNRKLLTEFLKQNRFAAGLFLVSTFLFVFQHGIGWSWDFLVYSMNGQYFFHDGIYVEWMRAPLTSFVMGLLQFVFPRTVSEYLFILIASSAFFYASYRVSERLDADLNRLYPLFLTPAALVYATSVGTEMLSLAFVMLFFADLERKRSGIWISLAFLTRYTSAAFLPLLILQKDLRKNVSTLLTASLPVLAWLGFNYVKTGDPFTSFANFLALNMVFRQLETPVPWESFLLMTLPTSLLLLLHSREEVRSRVERFSSVSIYFLTGMAVAISILYVNTDPNPVRYLYPLLLPVAVFALPAMNYLMERFGSKVLYAFVALNLVVGTAAVTESGVTQRPEPYVEAAELTEGCMTESNRWPFISYAGTPSEPVISRSVSLDRLNQGYSSIYFGNSIENPPDYVTVTERERFTVYSVEGVCKESQPADQSFLNESENGAEEGLTPTEFMVKLVTGKYHFDPGLTRVRKTAMSVL